MDLEEQSTILTNDPFLTSLDVSVESYGAQEEVGTNANVSLDIGLEPLESLECVIPEDFNGKSTEDDEISDQTLAGGNSAPAQVHAKPEPAVVAKLLSTSALGFRTEFVSRELFPADESR